MLYSITKTIKESKITFSGIAILIIILCHLAVVDSTLPFVKIFTPGFIGVDIFIFYSGYSLGYSYTKRSLGDFFLQRIKRIIPMFMVFSLLSSLIHIYKGETLTFWDWICNLTTLSYYGAGGFPIDWFLSSIFLFYLVYPFLFTFVEKCNFGSVIVMSVSTLLIIAMYDIYEYYGCAISRLPIFCLGIWFYQRSNSANVNKNFGLLAIALFFIMCVGVLLKKFGFYMHGYFLVDMFCPSFLLIIGLLLSFRKNVNSTKFGNIISFLGNHSIEVYIANYLSLGMMTIFIDNNCYSKAIIYFAINVVLMFFMIYINTSVISKYYK